MAERTHIPSSPACGEWETLLADALDGLLRPEDEARFTAHKADCAACSAMYEEARKGREWLEFLSPEPEVPAGLLEKILAQTGPGHAIAGDLLPVAVGVGGVPAFMPPVWQQPGFLARMRSAAQPRLLMTAAMAFFSIALTLNMTGVRFSSVRLADLRPRTLRSYMERQLIMASVPIVRYYDHLRFVYEVESRVRELRGEGEGGEQRHNAQPATPGETKENPQQRPGRKDGGSRVDPPQQSGSPAMEPANDESNELIEASLRLGGYRRQGGEAMEACERSTPWIA
jgi:hypothetical protein